MAINKDKNFAFIHIPKTGGTTLTKELNLGLGDDVYFAHSKQDKYDKSFKKYSVVRNPYDRFISSFFFLRYTPFGEDSGFSTIDDLKEKIKEFGNDFKFIVNPRRHPKLKHFFIPQCEYLKDRHGKINVEVFKFENFYETYINFCEILDITPKEEKNLLQLRKSNHDDWRTYYNDDLQKLVYEHYKEDFELFGYSKEIN